MVEKMLKHDWKMGVGPWKECIRCGLLAYRSTQGWTYRRGLKVVQDDGCKVN